MDYIKIKWSIDHIKLKYSILYDSLVLSKICITTIFDSND